MVRIPLNTIYQLISRRATVIPFLQISKWLRNLLSQLSIPLVKCKDFILGTLRFIVNWLALSQQCLCIPCTAILSFKKENCFNIFILVSSRFLFIIQLVFHFSKWCMTLNKITIRLHVHSVPQTYILLIITLCLQIGCFLVACFQWLCLPIQYEV